MDVPEHCQMCEALDGIIRAAVEHGVNDQVGEAIAHAEVVARLPHHQRGAVDPSGARVEAAAVAALYDWARTEWNWGGDEYQSVRDAVNVVMRALDQRGAVSAERWNIAIWDDGTIAGIYPVSGPQPAPRSDMRIVEVAPVNPQAGAVSADLPEVERLRKASDEVIGHLVARVEQLEAALRQIGEMAGAKANGKDARAMGKAAREALRS